MTADIMLDDVMPRAVSGATDAELDTIKTLVAVWQKKYRRNLLRSVYFDGKMPLKPTGNIPWEAMHRTAAVLGWPEKAVTSLADRCVFEGFVAPNQEDPYDLSGILDDNRFDLEFPQAVTSALKHSCSFVTTALGDVAAGEPEVLVMARSAEWSAGLWDPRRRRVSAALAITSVDEDGHPDAMDAYLPDRTLVMERRSTGRWVAQAVPNPLGEPLVTPLTYDPQLDRPFGRSRITRAVMNITDHALMAIVRGEIAADFYAAPRLVGLNVAADAIRKSKWDTAIDRFLTITADEYGNEPKVQQLPQLTMQPLVEQYRAHAARFSGETGVPLSDLGIVQDNPPSAEAIHAAEKSLIVRANATTRVLGGALKQIARKIILLRDGRDSLSPDFRQLDTAWANPAFTSPVTAADAVIKLVSAFPWLAESEVALEKAGLSQSDITRALADKRRAEGGGLIASLRQMRPEALPEAVAAPGV